MPRRKNPINPELTGPVVQFVQALRELRARAGTPSYDTMAKTGFSSKATLATADNGDKLASWEATKAYVHACGGDQEEWRRRWQAVHEEVRVLKSGSAKKSSLAPAPHAGPLPCPDEAKAPAAYRAKLNELREWAGRPSYQTLSDRTSERGHRLPRSTIGDMLTGQTKSTPKSETVRTYLIACGLPADQHDPWLSAYDVVYRPGVLAGEAVVVRHVDTPQSHQTQATDPPALLAHDQQARVRTPRPPAGRPPSVQRLRPHRPPPAKLPPDAPPSRRRPNGLTPFWHDFLGHQSPSPLPWPSNPTSPRPAGARISNVGSGTRKLTKRQLEERDDSWADLPHESDPRRGWRDLKLAVTILVFLGGVGVPIHQVSNIVPPVETRDREVLFITSTKAGGGVTDVPEIDRYICTYREIHKGIWNGAIANQ